MQSHLATVNVCRRLTTQLGTPKGSVWLLPLPLYSVGGSMFKVIGTLWNEGSLVIVPDFDPGLILQLIEEEHVTFFSAVPTMYLRIFEHPDFARRDLRSLDALCCGGSTVPEELVQKIEQAYGAEYIMMFGLTEMCGTVCQTVRGDTTFHKARTIGKPLPGIEIKIVSTENLQTLGVNEPGEICVRGVGRMQRYFEMPEATAAAIDAEGWLHTGDIGTIAEDGYCTITGRLKDMIRRGGMNIYPREIEDVLSTHRSRRSGGIWNRRRSLGRTGCGRRAPAPGCHAFGAGVGKLPARAYRPTQGAALLGVRLGVRRTDAGQRDAQDSEERAAG
jgi:fatty-acyl-CoA synthase